MADSVSSNSFEGERNPPLEEPLLTLAPTHLPNRRKVRYQGDSLCITLEELRNR